MTRPDGAEPGAGGRPASELGGWAPARRGSVAGAHVDGEAVLVDVDSWSLHVLDPVASVVWACLDGATTLDQLVDDLSDVFAAEPDQVRTDVFGLAVHLDERDLLEAEAPAGTDDGERAPAPPAEPRSQDRPRFLERAGST